MSLSFSQDIKFTMLSIAHCTHTQHIVRKVLCADLNFIKMLLLVWILVSKVFNSIDLYSWLDCWTVVKLLFYYLFVSNFRTSKLRILLLAGRMVWHFVLWFIIFSHKPLNLAKLIRIIVGRTTKSPSKLESK